MPLTKSSEFVELHGRKYQLPTQPLVAVCIDGFDPEYLERGCKDGILPVLTRWMKTGFHTTARCAMPSLTCPNNLSIITGAPTSIHGIAGNYFLDKFSKQEHMVLDDSTMHGSTILADLADAGKRVAAITAKDKLRRIIQHGLSPVKGAICFSSQCASECSLEEHGIANVASWLGQPLPPQYSGELSLFVLDAGLKLLQEGRVDVMYLTLSDYIQHKYAPGAPEADDFMSKIDTRLGALEQAGALIAVTGDHGMSAKSAENGSPNVLFLEDFLASQWPETQPRVICPIADSFVKHHGALGGFVRVHFMVECPQKIDQILGAIRDLPQVFLAWTGDEAAANLEMPVDREGDIVVIANKDAVIGARSSEHDMSIFASHPLRSHGGLSEQEIPLLRSQAIANCRDREWRNFDIFDLLLNH
ncbi:Phosphonoacetate hydrolase [Myriangium duriaei CBS 260.36]|uniref:Phosphonoacetate hydrolase n=1 Tax=Myriangium duriaei CBS 260.36 TaxID=1168546 RepID=A0A9P4J365_9PEZI|nr:Phosphonoacetate hydrolase [Myriangium duriaei CBS 260.36]